MKESETYYRRCLALALLQKRTAFRINGKPVSQEDISERAGISTRYYGKIERGESTPSVFILSKIAFAFNITLSDLCKQLSL